MVTLASCAPQSLVVTTTTISTTATSTPTTTTTTTTTTTQSPTSTTTEKLVATEPLETTKFHIKSEIQFRYARTVVESTVTNPDTVAQLASFALVIPDSAFISAFSMEIKGEEYNARVEEKEEAEKTFEKALSRGRGAGLVSQDAKDANKFTVSTNIEGGQEVVFRLTYDELLGRKEGMYRQEINIDPQQIVEDFRVEVFINESLPITEVKVPELLQSNSIDPSEETQNSFVTIEKDFEGDVKKARIVLPQRQWSRGQQLKRGCREGSRSTTTWTGRTRTARCRSSTDILFTSLFPRTWRRCQSTPSSFWTSVAPCMARGCSS